MKRKRKNKPGQGRKPEGRVIANIGMLPEAWDKLDARRGPISRGREIERMLGVTAR